MSTRQRKFQRQVGWGEALYLEVHLRSPGLKHVVENAIHPVVGKGIGTRNTFAKLFDLDGAPAGTDRWRAWLLLTCLGQDPMDWDITDEVVPEGFSSIPTLRDLLIARSGWLRYISGSHLLAV